MDHACGSDAVSSNDPWFSKKYNCCKFLPVHTCESCDKTQQVVGSSREENCKHEKDVKFLSFFQPGCIFIISFFIYKFFDKINSVSAGNDKCKNGTDTHANVAINKSHNGSEYQCAHNTGYKSWKYWYYYL